MAKPQRHRGTEKTQSRPPGVCPQITQMTQIHRNTTQRRKGAETQRDSRKLDRPARSRPPGGQGPLGVATAPGASAHRGAPTQRHALSESARLASHVDKRSTFEQARPRRDRRALRVGRGEDRLGRTLAFGADGLRHGCRRSSDRRRFRRTTLGNLVTAGSAPLCSSCLRGCGDPWLCVLCASVVCPVRWICVICVICGKTGGPVPLWFSGRRIRGIA
jgi:hypothetical protein